MNAELESLVRSYARLSYDVIGRINFACDVNNDEALRVVEREQLQLDQAFFVLSFAALEYHITSIACARLTGEDRRIAMRSADFGRRWDVAAKLARETLATEVPWERSRPLVLNWYAIRSDITHGRPPSQLADVPTVVHQADQIAATHDQVVRTLNGP